MTDQTLQGSDLLEPTAFDRIGGSGTINLVVHRFYEKVLYDNSLAPYFDGVNLPRQRRHLALLVGQLLGGPREYEGRDLGEAHAHLRVTDEAYDAVVRYLVETLAEFGADDDVVAQVRAAVAEVRAAVVTAS